MQEWNFYIIYRKQTFFDNQNALSGVIDTVSF